MAKNKVFSLINILGLAVGITAFIIIMQYIRFENSYDNMHKNKDNIYRVESQFYNGNELTDNWATSSYGYATAMKQEFPDIIDFARINLYMCERIVRYDEIKYREPKIYFADSSFLTMFSYPMLLGDPTTALKKTNTVVLTEKMAKKYFKDENPIGKMLNIQNFNYNDNCEVTGVLKDLPHNTHLEFDMLVSWNTCPRWMENFWYMHEAYTYLLLKPETDIKSIEGRFPEMAEKYKTGDALKEAKWAIKLTPLKDIHLNKAKGYEAEIKGNRKSLKLLLLFAIIIIAIAWINYINLTTAKLLDRGKEASLRKVAGSKKWQIIIQFLTESFLYNLFAFILSITFVQLFLPQFENIIGKTLIIWNDPVLWMYLTALIFGGVFISGIYPAIFLSRFQPAKILKGKLSTSIAGEKFRKGLVIIQFASSVVFIVGTLVIFLQIKFMTHKNLGMDINQVLVLKVPSGIDDFNNKIVNFKNEMENIPSVISSAVSSAIPGKSVDKYMSNRRFDALPDEDRLYKMLRVDFDYIDLYNLEITNGRKFSDDYPTDSSGLILTETAAKLFGFKNSESAINQEIRLEGQSNRRHPVIGVLKNYHHQSAKELFSPTILFVYANIRWINPEYISVKINLKDINNTITAINKTWETFFPDFPFDYFFLTDFFNAQYQTDRRFGKVYTLFSILAIFIACLGLFGLSLVTTAQRTKEIGVRKAIGSTLFEVVMLFSKDFLRIVVIGIIIALPVSYLLMNSWIQNYAFKIELKWWIFVIPSIIIMVIALFTVSFHVIKTALMNPVEALRYE